MREHGGANEARRETAALQRKLEQPVLYACGVERLGVQGDGERALREPWRRRPRVSVWDLSGLGVVPVIIAGVATWGTIAYLTAAIGGFRDIAGNSNRWLSALYGLACLGVAAPVSVFVVLWLRRPARPSEVWPKLSKWFSRRIDPPSA